MNEDLKSALDAIDVSTLDYQKWIEIGMAIKNEGLPCSIWDNWSQKDTRYHTGECQRKWDTFSGAANPVTSATIFQMAMDRGWRKECNNTAIEWDEAISEKSDEEVQYDPVKDIERYLKALFKDDEYVGYCVNSYKTEDGKYCPSSAGNYARTSGELLKELFQCNGDIGAVFGDYDRNAGAWIRFNALDGKGAKNLNVTRYSYALVESDSLPIAEQNRIYRELNLPIAVLVNSAGKSLHAIVRVDAKDEKTYRERVNFLYKYLKDNGVAIDSQNRNPSRLSRMPGIKRGDKWQRITAIGIGAKSWDEWREWLEENNDSYPAIEQIFDSLTNPPRLPESLIDGILRIGHKMLLTGPSKAGKSFSLMELSFCISEGLEWLGFKCRKSKVLYVNLEIDRASCHNRFLEIFKAMAKRPTERGNLGVWDLRGHAVPLDRLVPKLILHIRRYSYEVVVIDPIYKVITGDENNASEMAMFVNQFDKICDETGCAVIYCHHHSKGAQGGKRVLDRSSGSGVFARDPDAVIDMIELELSAEDIKRFSPENEYATAWRIEGSLREFKPFKPFNCWFTYPIHTRDVSDCLKGYLPRGYVSNLAQSPKRQSTPETRKVEFDTAFDICCYGENQCSDESIMEYLDIKPRTFRDRLKELKGHYSHADGKVFRIAREVSDES